MPRQHHGRSAPHSRTVRQCTSVRVQHAKTSRHVPPSRPHSSATPPLPPEHPVLSPSSHSLKNFSLSTPSHGEAPPLLHPLKDLHLAGASPEIDADELHHLDFIFFLGARSFPSFSLHPLPLSQASSKKNKLELHKALYLILKPLPVFHPSPVCSSPPRSTPHCPRLQAMKPF